MDNEYVQFGKYKGLTFRQVLDKDVSYCEFIARCPTNDRTRQFQDYVIIELPGKKKQLLKDRISALTEELKKTS